MRTTGRFMQLAGLTLPPLEHRAAVVEAIDSEQMLTVLVASVCLFGIGRIVEGYSA